MIKLYNFDELKPEEILNRDIRAEKNVEDVVDGIIADVRARGDEALKEYALRFDGAKLESLQVTQEEIEEAFAGMDGYFLETLREAAANIEAFHRQQVHKNFVMNDKPGIVLGQKYTPIEKAGVYVPGGTAAYPSTVLMDVIPAKVAGVSEIVMTTPAGKDGKVNPVILAAAATAGVTKIFKTGGAQAVAALAYGTQTIPAVDKIVGPGNIYVATAKRKVFGKVGIDMIAGPSEILVLADGGCDPAWVAADLLSQAEHDKLASPVLVTDSADLAKAVQAEEKARRAGEGSAEVLAQLHKVPGCENLTWNDVQIASTIFAVKPGDGSAREQAASCQRVLGAGANIVTEYATKRYRSNLINWGMLPLQLVGATPFGLGDYVFIPNVREALKGDLQDIKAYVLGDTAKEFSLYMAPLTADERKILADGCLINFYKH